MTYMYGMYNVHSNNIILAMLYNVLIYMNRPLWAEQNLVDNNERPNPSAETALFWRK